MDKESEAGCENLFLLGDNKPNIIFSINDVDFLKIDEPNGLTLYRENFPNFNPDDFVKEFLDILEKNFNVKFVKK